MNETIPISTPLPQGSLFGVISRLATAIAHAGNADRAAIKRWSIGRPLPMAFYRLWLLKIGEEFPPESQITSWALLAWGLALMGGRRDPKRSLGTALAKSGLHEMRLERLLQADKDLRPFLFASIVRFLAVKDESFDWTQAAAFLLTHDSEKREALHRRIAADYYRHLSLD